MTTVCSGDLARLLGAKKPCSRAALGLALSPTNKLAEVLLSTVRLEGHHLGVLGESILDNNSQRERFYAEMEALLPTSARVLKGSRVSQFYPPGVARALVDLDVWCADEASLWEVAGAVGGSFDTDIALAMWESSSGRHFVVAYDRPSKNTDFEAGYRIELSTAALPGDFNTIPTMDVATLPQDVVAGPLLDLLLVAAEQHQRGVIGRDVIDAVYLLKACDPEDDLACLQSGARATHLVDEVCVLLGHWLVQKYVPWAKQWAELLGKDRDGHGTHRQSEVALPVQGIHLRLPPDLAERPTPPLSEVQNGVLCSPIGTFALTSASEICADWMVERNTAAVAAWRNYVS